LVKRLVDIWTWKINSQKTRWIVQAFFFLLVLFIGYKFYLFVEYIESGGTTTPVARPPGIEAFLPIGALIGIKYFLVSGKVDPIHPAGFVILSTILLSAFLLGRGFCSWMCPVGTCSEWFWMGGKRLLGRNFKLPTVADWALRSLKYIMLFFFIYQILIKMDSSFLDRLYQQVPYIRVADVKMMKFFTHMTNTTMMVLGALVVLSFVTKNFWCRYLCPYGAFLGLLWYNNPLSFRVVRNDKCIDCGACTRACPVYLDVMHARVETSPECWHCYDCINACPVPGALEMKVAGARGNIPYWVYAFLLIGFFVSMTTTAKYKGHWQTSMTTQEYIARVAELNNSKYEHKRGKFTTEESSPTARSQKR
jgi:polyferredoxin